MARRPLREAASAALYAHGARTAEKLRELLEYRDVTAKSLSNILVRHPDMFDGTETVEVVTGTRERYSVTLWKAKPITIST